MNKYKSKMGDDFFNNMYIDSSVIPNVNNSNLVGYSYKYKNKKSIKINAICDDKKIIHSAFFSSSSIYDSKLIINPVNKLETIPKYLMGDLGYITNKKTIKKLSNKNITLVTGKRKNMKKVIPKKHEQLLKNRCVIEHRFSILKRRYRRFQNMYDRKINTITGFLQIAVTFDMFIILDKS
jgi:hypothetical protein